MSHGPHRPFWSCMSRSGRTDAAMSWTRWRRPNKSHQRWVNWGTRRVAPADGPGPGCDSGLRSSNYSPRCVFNLVESLGGDGRMIHFVPTLLSTAGIPFTGCSGDAIFLSSQKQLAKQWMRLNAIPTPDCLTRGETSHNDIARWIVKSRWEHASFGMDDGCVVSGAKAAQARIESCTGQPWR